MMIEIKDFTGYYVSDDGNIYSTLGRGCKDKTKKVEPYIINQRLSRNGYARVCLRRDGTHKRVDIYVHRLIAEYFVPNPMNKKVVNHKNCIRNDNRPENLEWVTTKENIEYALKYGNMKRDKYGRYTHK